MGQGTMQQVLTRKLMSAMLASLPTLVVSVTARGDLVKFAITGETTLFVDGDGVGWSIPIGTELSGTFTFDAETPDADPTQSTRGQYFDSIIAMSLKLGDHVASQIGGLGDIIVTDNRDDNDHYSLLNEGVFFRGYESTFGFLFADAHATAFASDALPITPPPIEEFEDTGFGLQGDDFEYTVIGNVTSLILVPEPSTLFLLVGATLLARRPRGDQSCL